MSHYDDLTKKHWYLLTTNLVRSPGTFDPIIKEHIVAFSSQNVTQKMLRRVIDSGLDKSLKAYLVNQMYLGYMTKKEFYA